MSAINKHDHPVVLYGQAVKFCQRRKKEGRERFVLRTRLTNVFPL